MGLRTHLASSRTIGHLTSERIMRVGGGWSFQIARVLTRCQGFVWQVSLSSVEMYSRDMGQLELNAVLARLLGRLRVHVDASRDSLDRRVCPYGRLLPAIVISGPIA